MTKVKKFLDSAIIFIGICALFVFNKMNRYWVGGFIIFILFSVSTRYAYIRGMMSERFDRQHANIRLQQCLDVIIHNSIAEKVCK